MNLQHYVTPKCLDFRIGKLWEFRGFWPFWCNPQTCWSANNSFLNKVPHLQITYHQNFWSFLLVMTKWVLQTAPKICLAMWWKFTNNSKHLYQHFFAERPDYPIDPVMPEFCPSILIELPLAWWLNMCWFRTYWSANWLLDKTPSLCITYYCSFWSFLMVMTKWVLQTAPKLWLAMLSKFTDTKHLYQCLFTEKPNYPIDLWCQDCILQRVSNIDTSE